MYFMSAANKFSFRDNKVLLYCIEWYRMVLYCSYCVALRCVALRCVALRCVALRCVALRCVALRCVALRCVALRCVALRCVALFVGTGSILDVKEPLWTINSKPPVVPA